MLASKGARKHEQTEKQALHAEMSLSSLVAGVCRRLAADKVDDVKKSKRVSA